MLQDPPPQPDGDTGQTDGVVTFYAPLAWIDWWVKGRFQGEKEPPGRPRDADA